MADGFLGVDFDDPRTRSNLAMAMSLLEAGGPSLTPTSLGQVIGRAGQAGLTAYDTQQAALRQKTLDDLALKSRQAEISEKNRVAALTGKLMLAKTPEARAAILAQINPELIATSEFEAGLKPPTMRTIYRQGQPVMQQWNPQTRTYSDIGPGKPPEAIIKEIQAPGGGTTLARIVPSQMMPGSLMAQAIEGVGVTPPAAVKPTTLTSGVAGQPGVTTTMQLVPGEGGGFQAQPIPGLEPQVPALKTGQQISVASDGTVTVATGVPGAALEKPTKKAIEDQILGTTKILSSLDQIDQLYDPSFLNVPTKISNYVDLTMEKLTGVPPQNADQLIKYSRFRASTQELFSTILKQLSGAAVTKFELDNAKTFLPDKGDSPSMFKAKVDNLRTITRAALYRAQQLQAGNDKITEDLARKYPLSLQAPSGRTVYIDQFVDKYMTMAAQKDVVGTQADALRLWAKKAQEAR